MKMNDLTVTGKRGWANIRKAVLLTLTLTMAAPAMAQDDDVEPEGENGYAKVYIEVKAVPSDKTGKVLKLSKTTSQLVWQSDWVLPSGTTATAQKAATVKITDGGGVFYLWTRDGQTDKDYKLVTFYLDNGDGEFDAETDLQLPVGGYNSESEVFVMPYAGSNASAPTHEIHFSSSLLNVYDTEAEAQNSTLPDKPQILVYAFYNNGTFAAVSSEVSSYGTVELDNLANNPSDKITLTATAEEGYEFAYWKDAEEGGSIVSKENPLTTTAETGKTLYAYFYEVGAPVLEFPAEGGYRMMLSDKNWMSDEFQDFVNYSFNQSNIKTADERTVFDYTDEESKFHQLTRGNDILWYRNTANFVYGKGSVRMAYSKPYNYGRGDYPIFFYAGKKITLNQTEIKNAYNLGALQDAAIFLWNEDLQAFLRLGDVTASSTVVVPAGEFFLVLLNGSGDYDMPVVATSAKAYDAAVSYLEKLNATVPGDANNDGVVDIVDVTSVISYILGQTPEKFSTEAADVNSDSVVDIVDVTIIIDLVLSGSAD